LYTTHLKKVGGSVMLAVTPEEVKTLALSTDRDVGMTIDNGWLIIEPHKRPRNSHEQKLAQTEQHAENSNEDRERMDAPAEG
ncbi:AbrB/MazE/SpoVT family DNA-binding domain-containing protein, partial [Salmonella enterica subsp. enterica serovar Infantis]